MNYSLNREALVSLMALVIVTGRVWQPARTHKQKQSDLGQDGASLAGYAMLHDQGAIRFSVKLI